MLVLSRVAAGARERWMLCSEAECSGASGTMILIQFGDDSLRNDHWIRCFFSGLNYLGEVGGYFTFGRSQRKQHKMCHFFELQKDTIAKRGENTVASS